VGRASKLWRRSALPVVEGAIEPLGEGSAIRLTFRREPLTSISVAMSLLVGALVAVAAIRVIFTTGAPDPFLLVAVAFPALFCWLAVSSFRREVRAAIRLLGPLGRPDAEGTRSLVRR
jgi:hypothetical protein